MNSKFFKGIAIVLLALSFSVMNAQSEQKMKKHKEKVEKIFAKLDANNDNKISKDEAKWKLKKHFDKKDTNQDGFITREELMEAKSSHHKKCKSKE